MSALISNYFLCKDDHHISVQILQKKEKKLKLILEEKNIDRSNFK